MRSGSDEEVAMKVQGRRITEDGSGLISREGTKDEGERERGERVRNGG